MTENKKKRGFAAMDPAKVAAIASKGGKAAHASGTAHQFSSEEARKAGRKGGVAPHSSRGAQRKAERSEVAGRDKDGRYVDKDGNRVIVPVDDGRVVREQP